MTQFIEVTDATYRLKQVVNIAHIVRIVAGANSGEVHIDLSNKTAITIMEHLDDFLIRLQSENRIIGRRS